MKRPSNFPYIFVVITFILLCAFILFLTLYYIDFDSERFMSLGIDKLELLSTNMNMVNNLVAITSVLIILPLIYKVVFRKDDYSFNIEIEKRLEENSNSTIEEDENKPSEQIEIEKPDLIDCYIKESSDIAERIYLSSKTYLFIGLTIAVVGIIFFVFYGQTVEQSQNVYQSLLNYLPRFGTLFFIEFIAFFFLKQYRILLEEYRYYECIKRDRQHKKVIIDIVEKYKDNPEVLKLLIDYMNSHSIKVPELAEGNKVELEKNLYNDMDILSKLTEFLKVAKQK